jgi:hypothetical protein
MGKMLFLNGFFMRTEWDRFLLVGGANFSGLQMGQKPWEYVHPISWDRTPIIDDLQSL